MKKVVSIISLFILLFCVAGSVTAAGGSVKHRTLNLSPNCSGEYYQTTAIPGNTVYMNVEIHTWTWGGLPASPGGNLQFTAYDSGGNATATFTGVGVGSNHYCATNNYSKLGITNNYSTSVTIDTSWSISS